MTHASVPGPDLIPAHRYRDAHAALAWLERAFGFEPLMVVPDREGGIMHAELKLGRSLFMFGTDRDDRYTIHSPLACGGVNTQSIYVAVPDAHAAFERAAAAGAEVVKGVYATDYGSHEFAVLDPDRYSWSFGTYHPVPGGEPAPAESEIYAVLRYVDAPAGIAFLERAFGFETTVRYDDADGVVHAELRYGASQVMVGPVRAGSGVTLPGENGGIGTQSVYVCVTDFDAHVARARAAGANVVEEPHSTDYGSRAYSVSDPQGHLWHFGTYRPALVHA